MAVGTKINTGLFRIRHIHMAANLFFSSSNGISGIILDPVIFTGTEIFIFYLPKFRSVIDAGRLSVLVEGVISVSVQVY